MFRAIWRWVIGLVILVSLFATAYPSPPRQSVYGQDERERLERLTQFGGPIHAAIFDGADALIAEGDSIVRVPLLGSHAYQPTERLSLDYGVVLDLLQTAQALYALTSSHILILDRAGHSLLRAIDGGGEHLNLLEDILIVETDEAGVRFYAISPDGNLVLQSQLSTASQLRGSTFLTPNLVAIADQSAGLRILNIDDPAHPQSIGTLQGISPADGIASFAQLLYVTNQHRVHIVNARNPQQPTVIGHYAPIRDVHDIQRFNDYIVIADRVDGLKVYEQSEVDQLPRYLNSQIATSTYHVVLDPNEQWLISTHQDGIRFYDASQLPEFRLVSFLPLWSPPTGISFTFDRPLALIPVGTGGLAIVDFSNPALPRVAAALPFSGPVQKVLAHPVYTNLLYLTLGDGQLLTVSIDPNNPQNTTLFSEINLSGQPDEMAIDSDGQLLAVATGRSGLNIYTLFPDPTHPRLIIELAPNSAETAGVTQIAYIGDRMWLTLNGQTLQLLSIHNRTLRVLDEIDAEGNYLTVSQAGIVSVARQNHLTTLSIVGSRFRMHTTYHAPTAYRDVQAVLGQVILAPSEPIQDLLVLDVNIPTSPTEQRFIPIPLPVESFVLNGDDILLTHPTDGLAHIRFPLLMATQPNTQPQFAGTYTPPQMMVHFHHGQNGELHVFGRSWSQWDLTSATTVRETLNQAIIDGVMLNDGMVFLDENLAPIRTDISGRQIAQNPTVHGSWLASDDETLWVLDRQGQLYSLDPMTLTLIQPLHELDINSPPTTLLYKNDLLLVGTQLGDLWAFDPITQSTIRLFEANSSILSLTVVPQSTHQLLLTTQAGDLWWLDLSDLDAIQILARYQTLSPILASSADPTGQWIAIGTETCGLQVLEAHSPESGLNLYAYHPDTPVTDVYFADNRVFALTAGIPTLYQFTSDGVSIQPQTPHHPNPRPMTELPSPVQTLTWQSDASPCLAVDYEVWIDGQLMGTTQSPQWTLLSPINHDFRWQIIAVDAYGNRAASPEWQVYLPLSGWFSSPPAFDGSDRLGETHASSISPPLWLFGLVLAGMGLLGLTTLIRRLVPRKS